MITEACVGGAFAGYVRAMMIKVLGDAALLVELSSTQQVDALDWVTRASAAIRDLHDPGVSEVVPALNAIGVHLKPHAHWASVAKRVSECLESLSGQEGLNPANDERVVELPVCYGGQYGPDLAVVARQAGRSEAEIIERHAAVEYRVQAIGFAPGFPYLSGLDPALACPRRETPRARVEAGSVGIGGAQTGVYPLPSPGGWQIIGRTPQPLFDVKRSEPSRLRAGDRLRFRIVDGAEFERLRASAYPAGTEEAIVPALSVGGVEVLHAGVQTTVQDAGRPGFQSIGVTEGGAVDLRSLRLANLMVGNEAGAAVLEWPSQGPRLRFNDRRVCVVMGAIAAGVPFGRPFVVEAGETLDLSRVPVGFRGVLAVAGGFEVPLVLGSRSTHLAATFGGWAGRALRTGDRLPLGTTTVKAAQTGWMVSPSLAQPVTGEEPEVRILRGPEGEAFRLAAWNRFLGERYSVRANSDRMGVRLAGPKLEPRAPQEMVSQPVVAGTVQVPPDGQPIVLMADRQSLGGYPRIATVISVDLPVLAQIPPGGRVRFVETTLAEAEALRLNQARDFNRFATAVAGRFEREG